MFVPLQQSYYEQNEPNPLVNRTKSSHLHVITAYLIEAYSNDNVKKNSETMALNTLLITDEGPKSSLRPTRHYRNHGHR